MGKKRGAASAFIGGGSEPMKKFGAWMKSKMETKEFKAMEKAGVLPGKGEWNAAGHKVISRPPDGFTVMFSAFLLHGLSFRAHEFLCRLLFIYNIHLDNLYRMPSSTPPASLRCANAS
jgi:hypothetical protein